MDGQTHAKHGAGYFVSKRTAICLTILVALVLTATVLLTLYLPNSSCEAVSDPPPEDILQPQPGEQPSDKDDFDGRLPAALEPYHYRVKLKPYIDREQDRDSYKTLDGETDIFVRCLQTTNQVFVHFRLMTIIAYNVYDNNDDVIEIEGTQEDPEYDWLIINTKDSLLQGKDYRIHFEYIGTVDQHDLKGFFYVDYVENGVDKSYVATQFQPTRARDAFPCFDEPALKATFDTILVHRPQHIALSNGHNIRNVSVEDEYGDEWIEAHYDTTVKMSTYLNAYFIGDFECKESYTENGIQFRVWSQPSKLNTTDYSLDIGMTILTNFEALWNISYQLPKLDSVALPVHTSTGMENWGLILYREPYMLYDPEVNTPAEKKGVVVLVGHELVHMWFGNWLTMKWWDHVWLNEGITSYFEQYGFWWVEPDYQLRDQFFLKDHTYRAMRLDQRGDSRPLVTPVGFTHEINGIFDILSYDKGSALILMMAGFIKELDLLSSLRHYLHKRPYDVAVTDDLWQDMTEALEDAYGMDIKDIMDPWVLQMGFPVVNITRVATNRVRASQQHFLLDPFDEPEDEHYTNMGYKWNIPLSFTHEREVNIHDPQIVWLRDDSAEFTLDGATNTDWILFNVNQTAYIRTNYDVDNWRKLAKQLTVSPKVIPVRSRSHLVDDAFSLGEALQLDHVVALELIQYFTSEDEHMPWQAFVSVEPYTRYMLWATSTYGLYERYLRDLVSPSYHALGWHFDDNELEYYSRINSLKIACGYNLHDCVVNASLQYSQWMGQPEINPIQKDTRSTVYCAAIRHGGDAEWSFAREMQKTDEGERARLQSAMACSRIPWILQGYLEESLNDQQFDAKTVIGYVRDHSSLGLSVAWEFTLAHFDDLHNTYDDAAYDIVWAFADKLNTEKHLKEFQDFGSLYHDMPVQAANDYYKSLRRIRTNMEWISRNGDDIKAFLTAVAG
ncbi:aminopeptidase N-like [Ptychodera flava]|uniref:aminopeptidase N-like n=1 Tax=Ptychodera flava TaxID=63121 RepID=UPI00396A8387